jgi:predicted CXXCH cytochrome family protein
LELLAASLALVLCALVLSWRAGWRMQLAWLAGALLLTWPLSERWSSLQASDDARVTLASHQPRNTSGAPGSPYAGSGACQSCHPGAYQSWFKSYHRRMTQRASDEAIIAEWDDVLLTHQGRRYRLFRKGDVHYVDMPRYGTNGEMPNERMVRPVVMTTGSHTQQLYWMPLPWLDEAPDPNGGTAFETFCADCHGPGGTGGKASSLHGGELTLPEINQVIDSPAHQKVMIREMKTTEREALLDFMERLQLPDRLMQFPFSYLIRDRRFVHEDDTFVQPPQAAYNVEPLDEGWSNSCDQCHSLNPSFALRVVDEPGSAQVAELGITCEACHGPAAEHVAYHRNPLTRYSAHLSGTPPSDVVLPTRLDKKRAAAVCGKCHAETNDLEDGDLMGRFRPGDTIEQHANVIQLHDKPYPKWLKAAVSYEEDLLSSGFWNDGTIRIAGRDYNGLVKSECHIKGELTCVSCHQMHGDDPNDQLYDKARTNAVCADCHQSIATDVSAHSHHPADSSGSLCYNCHMPHTTLGIMSVIRAHRIDVPNIRRSEQTGRPNACNLCHLDRSTNDMANAMNRWYGHDKIEVTRGADGKKAPPLSAAVDWLLTGDGTQRTVAAWHFGWKDARDASGSWWMAPLLAELLDDPYSSVRYQAGRSLMHLPGFEDYAYDFVADGKALISFSKGAREHWSGGKRGEDLPAVLMMNGVPDDARRAQLLQLRDDAPVSINE